MMRLALLGDPVEHSRSPAIHSAALEHLGIDGEYRARRTDGAGVVLAVTELRSGALDGANVTMPLKADACAAADKTTEVAHRAGAANTLWADGGVVWAATTDVDGVRDVWVRRALPDGGPVLVLGSGGAAAAAVLAVEGRPVHVSSRRPEAVTALLDRLEVDGTVVAWGTPISEAVVINATPLGMGGEALPEAVLEAAGGLVDLAYGPEPTPAVLEMGVRPVADGLDVLVAQAARSFEIWTNREAPRAVMEAAARR